MLMTSICRRQNNYVTHKLKLEFARVENIVGKEEKCWLPAFSHNVFKSFFSSGSLKPVIVR